MMTTVETTFTLSRSAGRMLRRPMYNTASDAVQVFTEVQVEADVLNVASNSTVTDLSSLRALTALASMSVIEWPESRVDIMAILQQFLPITHADGSRASIAIIRLCDYVCLSACLSVRTIKPKQLKLKYPNLAQA